MEKKLINRSVRNFLRKTDRSLVSCEVLFKEEFYEDVISKAYYAFLYLVKALLITKGITVKSHSSARRQFSLHYVKSGLIKVKYSKYFAKLLDSRFECDYDERYTAEKFLAEEAIVQVKSFKEEVYKILKCKN
ncbi:MAG: HEPN domain-containing protein [bacterium]